MEYPAIPVPPDLPPPPTHTIYTIKQQYILRGEHPLLPCSNHAGIHLRGREENFVDPLPSLPPPPHPRPSAHI